MPAALPPEKRAAIEDDIREGHTRNAIARDHSVSGATVSKIAKGMEATTGTPPFEQSQTKRARERRSDDLAALRVELAGKLMQDAFDLRERMWGKQYQAVVVPQRGGGAVTQLMEVPASAGDYRNYLTAIGIAVDKVAALTRDESEGLAAVDAWLRSVMGDPA